MDDLFTTRRSIRRFKDREIEPEKVGAIYEAVRWAPSWGNQQCAEIISITNTTTKEKLSGLLSPKNPATKSVERAPLVIAVCGSPQKSGFYKEKQVTRYGHWFLYDLGIVSQNICLKAHELGLGSVIVGSFDHERAEQLLGIVQPIELVSLIAIGYPDHAPPSPKRKPIDEFVHMEEFGNTQLE